MSVAHGQEALELDLRDDGPEVDDAPTVLLRQPVSAEPSAVDPEPTVALQAPASRRVSSIALPPRPPVLSPLRNWLRALRPGALPATLLGGAVGGLLVARDPAARPGLLGVGLLLLVLGHALTGFVRDLGDARPGRAGPLRRREAGRATLVVAGSGVVALGVLSALHDPRGLLLLPLGAVAVLLTVSRRVGVALAAVAGLLSGSLAVLAVAWAGSGRLDGSTALAGLVVGAVLAGLLAARRARVAGRAARLLVLLPYVAAGAAVWAAALPWTALAVALALPAARTASSAATSASSAARGADAGPVVAGHARLFAVLLVAGLVGAALTGADLPLA